MTLEERKYWKIRAALEELLRVEEEDIFANPVLEEFLDVASKIALAYQVRGATSMLEQTRAEMLEAKGISMLKPRPKT